MRAFIAIDLPKEIKDALAGLEEQLKSAGADIKWVTPNNIHLTLKFLGEIDNKRLDKINAIITEVAYVHKSFPIRIASVGAFPKIDRPRVIWIGIDKGDAETKVVASQLEEKIAKVGIPKEKRGFSSHITIGRAKSGANIEKLAKKLEDLADDFDKKDWEFSAKKITLYKSTLTPSGPIYETLQEVNLQTI